MSLRQVYSLSLQAYSSPRTTSAEALPAEITDAIQVMVN